VEVKWDCFVCHPHLNPLPSRERRLLRPNKSGLAMTGGFEGEELAGFFPPPVEGEEIRLAMT